MDPAGDEGGLLDLLTVVWSLAIGACVTLAMIHVQISFRMKGGVRKTHLLFAGGAFSVAATSFLELSLLHATSLEAYRRLMGLAQGSISSMLLFFVGFACWYYGRVVRPLAWASCGATLCTLGMSLSGLPEWSVRWAEDIRRVEFLGLTEITLATYRGGAGTWMEALAVGLLLTLVGEAALRSWRAERNRGGVAVGASLFFFLLITKGYAIFVERGVVETPFFFVFPVLAILVTMGRELSLDVVRAVELGGELRESEKRMAMAAKAAHLGLWEWRGESGELWVTEQARDMLALPATGTMTPRRCLRGIHPGERGPLLRKLDEALKQNGDFALECRGACGSRWILVHGGAEKGDSGRFLSGIVMDVTERRRFHEKLEELRGELAHVSRVSTMGELAASLAHELNQPLAAILSNAEAATRYLSRPDPDLGEIRAILGDIVADDRRAGDVIHRLREIIQKKERVEAERVDLNAVVRDAGILLAGEMVSRGAELHLWLSDEAPGVWAGRVELQQVLLNLMVNGLDAMEGLPRGQRRLHLETECGEDRVWLRVRDNGPGIPVEQMERVFDPFFSTKPQGLGMGLAISRSLVEAHQGRLTATNLQGQGVEFTVEFPRRRG